MSCENFVSKFEVWASFLSTWLVTCQYDIFMATGEDLHIPEVVQKFTQQYQNSSDTVSEFVDEVLFRTGDKADVVQWTNVYAEFTTWFKVNHTHEREPSKKVVKEVMEQILKQEAAPNYCAKVKNNVRGWHGVKYRAHNNA